MNTRSRTVVVGLDGSESSERALSWAVEEAVLEGWTVTLVHAELASAAFGEATMASPGEAQAVLRRRGTEILEAGRAQVTTTASALRVTAAYEVGGARDALLAHSHEAAMVVVGSHGRGPVRTLVLGSVGVWLVKHARCPVVVHRPGAPGGHTGGIVVASDALVESQPVLEAAWRQAELRGRSLTVLHCYGGGSLTLGSEASDTARAARNEEARLSLAEGTAGLAEKYPTVEVRTQVVPGTPVEALVALGSEPDLVVVGAHQRSLARQLAQGVGSSAVGVVERATCPVMVVPVGEPVARADRAPGVGRPEPVASS